VGAKEDFERSEKSSEVQTRSTSLPLFHGPDDLSVVFALEDFR
jgi:hypothetical protein